jgi:hypothetical protein
MTAGHNYGSRARTATCVVCLRWQPTQQRVQLAAAALLASESCCLSRHCTGPFVCYAF